MGQQSLTARTHPTTAARRRQPGGHWGGPSPWHLVGAQGRTVGTEQGQYCFWSSSQPRDPHFQKTHIWKTRRFLGSYISWCFDSKPNFILSQEYKLKKKNLSLLSETTVHFSFPDRILATEKSKYLFWNWNVWREPSTFWTQTLSGWKWEKTAITSNILI